MTDYRDTTPIPSKVNVTTDNIDAVSSSIANWIRTKKYGIDTREAIARSVELFSKVCQQFINQTDGIDQQFKEATANVTTDSEVITARTSTVTGLTNTTLGERLDGIDNKTANLVDDESQIKANKDNIEAFSSSLASTQTALLNVAPKVPSVSSSYITTGIILKNGTTIADGGYKVITFGARKLIYISMSLNISVTSDNTKLLEMPFFPDVQRNALAYSSYPITSVVTWYQETSTNLALQYDYPVTGTGHPKQIQVEHFVFL